MNLAKKKKKAIKELNQRISLQDNLFYSLPTALESVKKEYPKADYKKIARRFIRKQGKFLWKPYKYDTGKSGVNGKDKLGYTPLHICCELKKLLELLIEEFKADVNVKNKFGEPVAFLTTSFGENTGLLRYLKEKGARLEEKDDEGNNILYGMVRDHKPNDRTRDLTYNFEILIRAGCKSFG